MNSTAAQASSPNAPDARLVAGRSPLAQLLHALNQPLTGLQCSMEVTLATPRTPEQYVRCLREGLELTERMRALVEALREVADVGEEENERQETIELKALLRETVEDLKPMAEVKNVRITLDGAETSAVAVSAGRRTIGGAVFRFLESALSLAARDNGLQVETASDPAQAWFRVRWQMGRPGSAFSRPELGLLVARAGFERAGAVWLRERSETFETVTVRLPGVAENRSHP
jgi:signal transduction histidine kinase